MTEIIRFLRRIRIVYRRSSTLLKCVVLSAILLSTVCLLALRSEILRTREETEALKTQASVLEGKKERIKMYIRQSNTVEGVERIAMEQLDLVLPGTIFFRPEG